MAATTKRPTLMAIKEMVIECRHYHSPTGRWTQLTHREIRIEFDKERRGVGCRMVRPKRGSRAKVKLLFRLSENWFESVWACGWVKMLNDCKNVFPLAAERWPAPGMDAGWRLLIARQLDNTLATYYCHVVEHAGYKAIGWSQADAIQHVMHPFKKALLG